MAVSRSSGQDLPEDSIFGIFRALPDPRQTGFAARHPWINIIVIALCAMICGAETFVDMQQFALSKQDFFSDTIGLDLSAGVPSHDTFGRAFAALDSRAFSELFVRFTQQLHELSAGKVVAIDGKTLRRAFDRACGRAIHMVNAWATQSGIALGQVKTDSKSNEITAVPILLAMLNLKGCIVTADAMSTQTKIAAQVRSQGGDYVLAVKDNQPSLHDDICAFFERVSANRWMDADARQIDHSYIETIDADHGRIEVRKCWCVGCLDDALHPDTARAWAGLACIALVECTRTDKATGQAAATQRRCFISSLEPSADRILAAVRAHWSIENNLHWVLDVAFNEDQSRARIGNAAQNLAILRQFALNLLRQAPVKGGIKSKRLQAGWDNKLLLRILAKK